VPSCAARLARPANVRFHATREDAERAGFRACRRCGPERPRAVRRPIGAERIEFVVGASSVGLVLVAHGARGVSAVLLGDDGDALRRELRDRFPRATLTESGEHAEHAAGASGAASAEGSRGLAERVIRFVESPAAGLDVPLDMRGTAFQRRVWDALRAIPAGSTATYSEVASSIGAPSSVRAVASACAANALAVIVPCHRVLRSDGALSGYRWGVPRKRALLDRERQFRVPGVAAAAAPPADRRPVASAGR